MSAGQDENLAPGPDAPEHSPDALSGDERNELNDLQGKSDRGILTPSERDHFDYLRRRDSQEQAWNDAKNLKSHPLLEGLPKSPEELVEKAQPDPVAFNRANSSTIQGLLATGAISAQDVVDHKAKVAATAGAPEAKADVAAHKAANIMSGKDENDGIDKDDNDVETVSAEHAPTYAGPERTRYDEDTPGGVPTKQNWDPAGTPAQPGVDQPVTYNDDGTTKPDPLGVPVTATDRNQPHAIGDSYEHT